MLHPAEIARRVRKTEGNYSGYLGNNTFNPVKSVMGYLVTHMVKVSFTPIFQLEAFTSMWSVWTVFLVDWRNTVPSVSLVSILAFLTAQTHEIYPGTHEIYPTILVSQAGDLRNSKDSNGEVMGKTWTE